MSDQIRYDLLTQQALRGVMRQVLSDAAKNGLPGEHHFYISFDTRAPGVRLSERMRAQYPEQMTVILQHQFWDLSVSDQGFEVGLSFGGVPEKLSVPFDAVKGFFDPSVQFGLQFEEVVEGADGETVPATPSADEKPTLGKKRPAPADGPAVLSSVPLVGKTDKAGKKPIPTMRLEPAAPVTAEPKDTSSERPDKPDKPSGGGEVVRLDRFRKK